MNKIKSETKKSRLLQAMTLERERFVAAQHRLDQEQLRSRGVSSTEGMLVNTLLSLATGGRFPAVLKKPVQALALSWLNGRFGRLVNSSLAQGKPKTPRPLFADEIAGDGPPVHAGAVVPSVQVKAVSDLRRVCNELNLAIQEGRTAEIEPLADTLKAQIIETRAALAAAAQASQTPVDRALARTRVYARTKPWAAVGVGAGVGYAAGMALALLKRWQEQREAQREMEEARRDFEAYYRQTAPRYRPPPRRRA